jgi:phage baseplate assembly protein W
MTSVSFYEKDFYMMKGGTPAVTEALKRLILTNPGERVDQPYFGLGLKYKLFEPQDEESQNDIRVKLQEQCDMFLPLVKILSVNFTPQENLLIISIRFLETEDAEKQAKELLITLGGAGEVINPSYYNPGLSHGGIEIPPWDEAEDPNYIPPPAPKPSVLPAPDGATDESTSSQPEIIKRKPTYSSVDIVDVNEELYLLTQDANEAIEDMTGVAVFNLKDNKYKEL